MGQLWLLTNFRICGGVGKVSIRYDLCLVWHGTQWGPVLAELLFRSKAHVSRTVNTMGHHKADDVN